MPHTVCKNRNHASIIRERILSRPIHIEDPQSNRWDSMNQFGDACMQLAATLICAISAERRGNQCFVKSIRLTFAVDSRRRSINDGDWTRRETRHCVKYVYGARQVDRVALAPFDRGLWYRRNRRQVKDAVHSRDRAGNRIDVNDVSFDNFDIVNDVLPVSGSTNYRVFELHAPSR